MCGIFGVISFKEKIDPGRVLTARDILAHRGPDDAGVYFSNCHPEPDEGTYTVALAHRRLSIIDLSSAAHQPMVSDDGRFVIVFNGEIYNYRSLIPNPSPKEKRVFKSDSDTEVILYLYAKYGKDCLQYLRGMFAIVIWDDKEKTLFAARDRFGIKPFYYYKDDESFIFSSELKAIKHYKGNLTINNDAVDAFLRTGSFPAPLTIYNEVSALLPGHYLTINNAQCTINNYWKFNDLFGKHSDFGPQSTKGNNTMDSRLHENDSIDDNQSLRGEQRRSNLPYNEDAKKIFPNAVTRASMHPSIHSLRYDDNAKKVIRNSLLDTISSHLVSDVEVGAFLSGGIDSTAIVSLMRQVGKEKIKTVSIVFPDSKFDESKYSRLAAKKYNTKYIEIPFYEKDLLDDFDKIMDSMEQPTIDGINTYFVSKAAKQAGLKVVLSGLGGDELFGGYPSFNLIPKYQRIKNLPFAKMFMKLAAQMLKYKLPAKAIEYMENPNTQNAEYKLLRGLFTDYELAKLGWQDKRKKIKEKSKKIKDESESKQLNSSMTSNELAKLGWQDKRKKIKEKSKKIKGESESKQLNSSMTSNELAILGWQDKRKKIKDERKKIKDERENKQLNSSMTENYFSYPSDTLRSALTPLQYVSMMESCFYMRNQLLRDSDIFSMVHSIELRVPFVDHILYATVLPYLDNAYDKNFPKKMLVEAVGDIPEEIIHRPKMGFTFPFEEWIKEGKTKNLINNFLQDEDLMFHKKELRKFINNFEFGKLYWSRVWALYIASLFGK